jgi:response regulator RpfG family c-di-GMP phosphodiesterase
MTHEEAVAELERYFGTQFDPNLVESFLMVPKEKSLIA